MVVKIIDHVTSASSYDDGEVIFRLLLDPVKNGQTVVVDFSGVASVPSAFVNSAFIRLLEHVSFDQVRSTLTFVQSSRQINELIRSRFEFVAQERNSRTTR
jgi:STAS-like domain of unknown function (DUF4325)